MARDVRRKQDEPVRITTAASSAAADISARQRRYVISMTIRTICFVGAIVVGQGWLRWVLVAAALLLPYVAVVMANATMTKDDGFSLPPGGFETRELEPGDDTPEQNGTHP